MYSYSYVYKNKKRKTNNLVSSTLSMLESSIGGNFYAGIELLDERDKQEAYLAGLQNGFFSYDINKAKLKALTELLSSHFLDTEILCKGRETLTTRTMCRILGHKAPKGLQPYQSWNCERCSKILPSIYSEMYKTPCATKMRAEKI